MVEKGRRRPVGPPAGADHRFRGPRPRRGCGRAVLPPDGRRRGLGPPTRGGQGRPAGRWPRARRRAGRHSTDRGTLRRVGAHRARGVRPRWHLPAPSSERGGLAGRAHTRRRTGGDPRSGPRRTSDPSGRIRRTGTDGVVAGRHPGRNDAVNTLVTGSSGLIGTALTGRLEAGGHRVPRLVRHPSATGGGRRQGTADVSWDPDRGTLDRVALERAGPFECNAVHGAAGGVPRHVGRTLAACTAGGGRVPDQARDPVPAGFQPSGQCRSGETGGTGDERVHGTVPTRKTTRDNAARASSANASGWVRCAPWPAPGISTSSAPGVFSASQATALR